MDEQFEFLRLIVQRLNAAGIPHMLTGSLALAGWARPRMTRDVDVVIEADKAEDVRMVIEEAGSLDEAYLAEWADALGLTSSLRAVRSDA